MASSLMCILNGRAYKNINLEMFKMLILFHIPNFSRALKDFIKSSNLGATQPKIDYLMQEKIGYYLPTNCR